MSIYAYYARDSQTGQEKYVTLQEHAINTHRIGNCLFGKSVEFLTGSLSHTSVNIKRVYRHALLLHDIGKALALFQNHAKKIDNGAELRFPLHEHVGAILLTACYNYSNFGYRLEYKYIAKVISRHHVAMNCRSPYELLNNRRCNKNLTMLRDILKNVADSKENIISFLNELYKTELVEKYLVEDLSEALDKADEISREFTSYLKMISTLDKQRHENRVVFTLAGYLVVSDILAASLVENRSDSSGLERAYVRYWVSELHDKLEACGVNTLKDLRG